IGMGGIAARTRELNDMAYWNHGISQFTTAARVMLRTWTGRLTGKKLVCAGAALIGQMLKAAIDRDVEIWTETAFQDFVVEDGRVVGVVLRRDGKDIRVAARHGVLLAAGGF